MSRKEFQMLLNFRQNQLCFNGPRTLICGNPVSDNHVIWCIWWKIEIWNLHLQLASACLNALKSKAPKRNMTLSRKGVGKMQVYYKCFISWI